MKKILLDHEIITRSLFVIQEMIKEPDEMFTKEMLNRLPELIKQEMTKTILLEKQLKRSKK